MTVNQLDVNRDSVVVNRPGRNVREFRCVDTFHRQFKPSSKTTSIVMFAPLRLSDIPVAAASKQIPDLSDRAPDVFSNDCNAYAGLFLTSYLFDLLFH